MNLTNDGEVRTGVFFLYRRNYSTIELSRIPDKKVNPRKRK